MMERADDYTNVLVASLGCGAQSRAIGQASLPIKQITGVFSNGSPTMAEAHQRKFTSNGSVDTMDYYIFSLFKAHNNEHNYLRVQTNTLMDNTKPDNLEILENCAKDMLKGDVKRVNPVTFELQPTGEGTYEGALRRVAETIYKEKTTRIGL